MAKPRGEHKYGRSKRKTSRLRDLLLWVLPIPVRILDWQYRFISFHFRFIVSFPLMFILSFHFLSCSLCESHFGFSCFCSHLRRADFRYTTILVQRIFVFVRASGEAILGTQRYFFDAFSYYCFVRASGEAILGTQRYCSMHVRCIFLLIFCSRLRRGDLRYATILSKAFSY